MFMFTLTPEQRRTLEHIAETDPRERVRKRAAALLLLVNGADEPLMATILGTDVVTPGRWFVAFEEDGVDGLADDEALDSFAMASRLLIRTLEHIVEDM